MLCCSGGLGTSKRVWGLLRRLEGLLGVVLWLGGRCQVLQMGSELLRHIIWSVLTFNKT